MAKFNSPRRWGDYKVNFPLCFVVLAVILFVYLIGFSTAAFTSYLAIKSTISRTGDYTCFPWPNSNPNDPYHPYCKASGAGDDDPSYFNIVCCFFTFNI